MSRYTGPKCRKCRQYGMVLCGKPANKCAWERRKSPPGDRSVLSQRRRPSEYAMQLKKAQEEQEKARLEMLPYLKNRVNYRKKCVDEKNETRKELRSELLESCHCDSTFSTSKIGMA